MVLGNFDRVRNYWLIAYHSAQLGIRTYFEYFENPDYDNWYQFCNSQMPLMTEWR